MPEASQLIWLFFSSSGRLGRQPYALAGLLSYLARLFPVYRIVIAPDEATATFWGGVFFFALLVSLAVQIPLTIKRLHDIGKTGWFAALYILLDIFMYLSLCFLPGEPGPNRYGAAANQPK